MLQPAGTNRRTFLRHAGAAAFAGLSLRGQLALAADLDGGSVLAPRKTHHPARAKNLIYIFLNGGMSHVDTFDHKPKLAEDHGKQVKGLFVHRSMFKFAPQGSSGLMVSELFPHVAAAIDDFTVIHSMRTDHNCHQQASLAMHTGSSTFPMPGIGAWLAYGLGSDNPNLPGHLVFCKTPPYAGEQVWGSSFLPGYTQGTRITPGPEPVPHLRSPQEDVTLREMEQRMLDQLNQRHFDLRHDDLRLLTRNRAHAMARRMMTVAPQIFNTSEETRDSLDLYGVKPGDQTSFGWQCLAARRLVEQGVRVVEIVDFGNWDDHGNMQGHRGRAAFVDRAIAGLVCDLKRRGLLDETLVVVTTEFGRTPTVNMMKPGRDHHPHAFTTLLAGGGVRGGYVHGKSDEYGIHVAENEVHLHDFNATILHLMGIDHQRLTYRYAGRDFRLTDVHGHMVKAVIA